MLAVRLPDVHDNGLGGAGSGMPAVNTIPVFVEKYQLFHSPWPHVNEEQKVNRINNIGFTKGLFGIDRISLSE
jgi:hypothetical protein